MARSCVLPDGEHVMVCCQPQAQACTDESALKHQPGGRRGQLPNPAQGLCRCESSFSRGGNMEIEYSSAGCYAAANGMAVGGTVFKESISPAREHAVTDWVLSRRELSVNRKQGREQNPKYNVIPTVVGDGFPVPPSFHHWSKWHNARSICKWKT